MPKPINEVFQKRMNLSIKGEEDYDAIFSYRGRYVLRSEGSSEELRILSIIIWQNGKMVFRQQWKKEEQEENLSVALVLRKQKEMMIYDGKDIIYSFGMKNEDNNEQAIIYFQSDITGNVVMASSRCPRVRVLSYIVKSPQNDAVTDIAQRIWAITQENVSNISLEVNNG